MDANKRFLRYNSIAIVAWPILSVWLPIFISVYTVYKKDASLFPIESLMPLETDIMLRSKRRLR